MRRAVLGLITVISLCVVGLTPASAASTPSKVGLVSYIAASKTSLTVTWPKASRATRYQIFVSTSYDGVSSASPRASTTSLKYTATGLKSGTDYFIQVRALNGSTPGARSSRVGHRTIKAQGTATGPTYKVMAYNICTRACMEDNSSGEDYYRYWRWSDRKPGVDERIAAHKPDVVMLQEAQCDPDTDPPTMVPPEGYASILCRSAKQLYYDDDRFDLAEGEECKVADDPYASPNPPLPEECTSGSIFLGDHGGYRWAVWAELIDVATGQHVIFASVHLVSGKSSTASAQRKDETYKLMAEIAKVNAEDLPVIYGGDFNSHKNRSPDWVTYAFNKRGYHDAYDLAMKLSRQHYNSYNDFQSTPITSLKWGDHVDHVWVDPTRTRVTSWLNGAKFVNGKYPHPIPSDHSPIVTTVQVN